MKLLCDSRLELWCEALESGRFEKCSGRLCKIIPGRGTCFCVLGVAIEVYWELNPDELDFNIRYLTDGGYPFRAYYWETGAKMGNTPVLQEAASWLPQKVATWYGIREKGQLTREFKFKGSPYMNCLDTLNDRGWSFKSIAGVIRRGYLERHYI